MKGIFVKVVLGILIGGLVIGGVVVGANYYPNLSKLVSEKINSIVTGKSPIGNLTVVRDLEGTWVSSIKGKGIQLYGKFTTGPGETVVYEEGDVELIINKVSNNTATGTIRYINLCSWGSTTIPKVNTISIPKQCVSNSGANAIAIRVSGTRLDFGTVQSTGATFTMQGNYLTDIISGTMTANISPYGTIKGTFNLMRKR